MERNRRLPLPERMLKVVRDFRQENWKALRHTKRKYESHRI